MLIKNVTLSVLGLQLLTRYKKQTVPGRFATLQLNYLNKLEVVCSQVHTLTLETDGRVGIVSKVLNPSAYDVAETITASINSDNNIKFIVNFAKIIVSIKSSPEISIKSSPESSSPYVGKYDQVDAVVYPEPTVKCYECDEGFCTTVCELIDKAPCTASGEACSTPYM